MRAAALPVRCQCASALYAQFVERLNPAALTWRKPSSNQGGPTASWVTHTDNMQHTPSSILKRRASNKENEQGNTQGAKKSRPRGRRVSFAPDDELATTHLFSKDTDGRVPRVNYAQEEDLHEDDMQVTEDLAARIPLGTSQRLNLPVQAGMAAPALSGNQQCMHEGTVQHPSLLAMMSPGAMMSPASFSMELTNNTDQLAANNAAASPAPQPFGAAATRPAAQGFEFTCNITSAVPALSTLLEEDEDSGREDSHVGAAAPAHFAGQAWQQQHHTPLSMELTGSAELPQSPAEPAAEEEPVSPDLDDRQGVPGSGANMDLDMSPTSPFALQTMQQHGMPAAAEVSDELKDKWGFTPGADDTLEMSHGRRVMGDTTYNHVYGPGSTMGDITLAMHAQQASTSNVAATAAGKPAATSRSAIAATANAAAAAAAATQAPGQAAATTQPAAVRPASLSGGALAHTPMHGQAEMTINLLADDQPVGGMWRQAFPAATSLTGHASVASSKPAPSQAGLAGDLLGADGGTTPGLLGNRSLLHGFGNSAAVPSVPGESLAAAGGMGMATGTRTVHNWTAQLLADGTTTAGPLGAFMQRVQQEAAAAAAGPAQGAQQAHTSNPSSGNGPRDDLTSASSSLLPTGPSGSGPAPSLQALKDATAVSMDFSPFNAAGAQLIGDGTCTLDDFAVPPELHTSQGLPSQLGALTSKAAAGASQAVTPPPTLPADRASGSAMKPLAGGSQQLSQMNARTPVRGSGSQDTGTNILRRALQATAMPHTAATSAEAEAGSGASVVAGTPATTYAEPQLHSVTATLVDEEPQHPAALPPITLQEFLGLVEIRFLDDMRRRTSFVPPYDLALLHGGGGKGRSNTALTYEEALEALHITGTHTKLQTTAIQELADKVEALQTRTTQAEVALARGNPAVFQDAQVCGPEALEELRDRMRMLKRVCRHRTLLAWKQQRIVREQTVATTQHEALSQLQEEAANLQVALEQLLALEQALEAAQSEAAERTQQLQEETKVQHAAREHDTVMNLRLSEMCAANQQRREQLDEVAAQQSTLQTEFEDALQQKASLRKQLQALQGQGVLRHTPEPEDIVAATPHAAATTSSQQSLAAAEARVASLRIPLNTLLLTQGLQLDLQAQGQAITQEQEQQVASWAVLVQGQFRISAVAVQAHEPEASQGELSDVGSCRWHLQVEALAVAKPLAKQLLHACLRQPHGQVVVVEPDKLMPAMQQLLTQLQMLHQLVEQLHDAQLNCTALTSMSVRPAAVDAPATASEQQQQQLVLSYAQAGLGNRTMPCKAEVLLPCTPQMLQPPGSAENAANMSAASVRVCIPAARAVALTPGLLQAVQRQLARTEAHPWDDLCQAVVQWMQSTCCRPAICNIESSAQPTPLQGCATQQSAGPVFITNPLFKPMHAL